MSIDLPPTAPSRSDAPATFISRMNAFLAWLVSAVPQMNTTAATVNTDAITSASNSASASVSAAAAAASATSAASAGNAAMWVSGSYNQGVCAWSPTDFKTYRAKTTGSKPTDPAYDPANWALAGADVPAVANPLQPAQHIIMTDAASGSGGITVADSIHMDFGTAPFSLRWKGSLPNWVPAAAVRLINKWSANVGYILQITQTTGRMTVYLGGTPYSSTVSPPVTAGTVHDLVATVVPPAVGVAGSVSFYCDGVKVGASVAIPAGAPVSVDTAVALWISGYSGVRHASATYSVTLYNRALSADEVLDLYYHGVDISDRWAYQTAHTSGSLVVGMRYRISTYVAGDDFANVGAASNAAGVEFIATGATPTVWTNASALTRLGATLSLDPWGIDLYAWFDAGVNALNATYPSAGASLGRQAYIRQAANQASWVPGLIGYSAAAGVGYGVGAGGTAVQPTSKSTNVPLNKVTGNITLNAASLAADTTVSFNLNNTSISANDGMLVTHVSGGTFGAYGFNARCAGGVATIDVRNLTGGALAEAIVIKFILIKAAIA